MAQDYSSKSYAQLQSLAKSKGLKANGKKDELIERIEEYDSTNSNSTTTSKESKKKKRDESEEEEEEEDTEDEEIEKPVAPVKRTSSKKPAAIDNKKRRVQDEEKEEEETEEKEDDDNDDHIIVPQTTTTTSTTSNGAQVNKVGPFEKCEDEIGKWIRDESIAYYLGEVLSRPKIASFDMDSTLIRNKSGRVHAINKDDWLWWEDCVPKNLKQLYNDGYQVVIFTNQGGIGHGGKFCQSKFSDITKKIQILEKELGFPLLAFIACSDDANRKPNRKMWDMMYDCTDGKVVINESESFYCGDAAGRPDGWKAGYKKDFSNSDLGFAMTVGIRFETPETHFLGEKHFVLAGGGDIVSSLIPSAPTTGKRFDVDSITTKDFEIVISVGFPASGKSTFAKKYFGPAGYEIINQDTLTTKERCIKAANLALSQGKSVIIDNTNGTKDVRSQYLALAKKYNAKARCLNFNTSLELAGHLNYYRERKDGVKHIPSMVYNIFKKNYQQPTTSEGFSSVHEISFVLELEEKHKQLYFIPNPKAKAK
ncbi:hypothetical protein RB653_005869 [Dictyostelium firmibasis]|uniref:SAP domain-containing protein n=1 Tax=Dictyostelium firmibasis TaxID=79012 RepID=A0AAN7UAC2_9MYCE